MTNEDKELLLKDLCSRLPYIPIIQIEEHDWNNLHIDAYDTPFKSYYLEPFIIGEIEIKPYLRPMSSMTEEEFIQYKCMNDALDENYEVHIDKAYSAFDWLNEHHFDYRGLIDKGLAIEAPEGMYKIKEK